MEVGIKLLNIETLITRNATWGISLNIQDFNSVRLPTRGVTKLPSSNRRSVLPSKLNSEEADGWQLRTALVITWWAITNQRRQTSMPVFFFFLTKFKPSFGVTQSVQTISFVVLLNPTFFEACSWKIFLAYCSLVSGEHDFFMWYLRFSRRWGWWWCSSGIL
jgi:hypothetical protein